jgi:hypothetical protein
MSLPPWRDSSPTNTARRSQSDLARAASITFDWTDVTDAASYTIQIDDSEIFSAPLVLEQNFLGITHRFTPRET